MKFNVFLILINFVLLSLSLAYGDVKKTQLLWGAGNLKLSKDEAYLTTAKDDSYYLTTNIEKLNLDLNNENFYFEFKMTELENFHGLEIRFSDAKNSENFYSYTLPYFSDKEFNVFKTNEWAKYGLSSGNLRKVGSPDSLKVKYVSWFLFTKKKPMSFAIKKLYKHEKPDTGFVSLTFDDGYASQTLAGKIAKEFALKATAYIMPRDIALNKEMMDLKQIEKLKKIGWDIQSHHSVPLTQMTEDKLNQEIRFGLKFLKEKKLHSESQHFAYPLGKHNSQIIDHLEKYFATARVAGGGMETAPPSDFFRVRTFNVLNSTKPQEIIDLAQKAYINKQWLLLMFHYLKEKPENELEYTPEGFKEICKSLKEMKVPVLTVDEVYQKYLK